MRRSAIVVGYGSIGARHARLLSELRVAVACVTRNEACPFPRHATIGEALAAGGADLIVVANATADHARTLAELAGTDFAGRVLAEKPLTGGAGSVPAIGALRVFVAYNLRFHPLISLLRQRLAGARLLGAAFHAGQYLPDWRPGTDYRRSYSASRCGGGGVLRDLSHELDLALWLCGPWRRVAALAGRFGSLAIETEDTATLLVETEACPTVSVSVNYLDRAPRREIRITAEQDGRVFDAHLDLIAGRLLVDGETTEAKPDRDATYRAQLEHVLLGRTDMLCSLRQGEAVDQLIVAAETAARDNIWLFSGPGREGGDRLFGGEPAG